MSSKTVVTETTVTKTTDDGGMVTETTTGVEHVSNGNVAEDDGQAAAVEAAAE